MSLAQVRLASLLIALALIALAVWKRDVLMRALQTFAFEESSAVSLALFRIAMFYAIFAEVHPSYLTDLCSMPAAMRSFPPGWRWLRAYELPFEPRVAEPAAYALLVTSLLSMIGLGTKVVTKIAALLGLYVLGLPNFFSKIDHGHFNMHAALVLAASPCGDALSVDRLLRRARGEAAPAPSTAYGLPIRMLWLLFGTVYLFPGLWKLLQSGDLWISGVQIKALLYREWGRRPDYVPFARIDQSDAALIAFGVGTLLFEIVFFFALLFRPSRVIAAFSAILFRISIWKFMSIRFSLWLPIILLFDFPQLSDGLRARLPRLDRWFANASARVRAWARPLIDRLPEPSRPAPGRSARAAVVVGTILLVGQIITGSAGIDTWPVAVFPRFSSRVDDVKDHGKRVTLILEKPGAPAPIDLGDAIRSTTGRARTNKLILKMTRLPSNRERLREQSPAIVESLRSLGAAIEPGDQLVLYREAWDLFQEGGSNNVRRRVLKRFTVRDDFTLAPAPRNQ